MSRLKSFSSLVSALAVSGLSSLALAQAPSNYNIVDLGTLANSTITAAGVNASGEVVGFSNVPTLNSGGVLVSDPHAFKTGPNGAGGAQDMGLMPYIPGTIAGTYARGVNDAGLIVGYGTTAVPAASTKADFNHAFISTGTTLNDIGTLGNSTVTLASGTTTANISFGYGVSNNGYVTGYGTNAQNGASSAIYFHAFRFNSNTESSLSGGDDLGTMGTGLYSYGYSVNNAGTVVGKANINTGSTTHAFRDTVGGTMQDLGSLNNSSSEALAINNSGTIVGDSYTLGGTAGVQEAYRLTSGENGITVADELFPGSGAHVGTIGSSATAINDAGTIVGYFNVDVTLSAYVYHAFVYGNQGYDVNNYQAYDLNNYLLNGAGWTLQYAEGINSAGQITGYGTINGATHAFLLTPSIAPVPEPGSVALCVGLAVSAAGFARKRRRAARL